MSKQHCLLPINCRWIYHNSMCRVLPLFNLHYHLFRSNIRCSVLGKGILLIAYRQELMKPWLALAGTSACNGKLVTGSEGIGILFLLYSFFTSCRGLDCCFILDGSSSKSTSHSNQFGGLSSWITLVIGRCHSFHF